ncbi:MAG: NUDIX hydrolase [Alphaproteobacteria bacterium]
MDKKITIGCIAITKKNGKYLLGIRNKESTSKGLLTLPGGTLEVGETIEQCLHREMMEEANIKIHNFKFVRNYELLRPEHKTHPHRLVLIYTADYLSGDLKGGDDCAEPEFYTKQEIKNFITTGKIPPVVAEIIEEIIFNHS